MSDDTIQEMKGDYSDSGLRAGLAHGDAMLGTIPPILRHLLANEDRTVFGDDIMARVRGMLDNIADQLIDELDRASGHASDPQLVSLRHRDLTNALTGIPALLSHVHALALEWQVTERLQARLGVDSVLSPLLQALIASPDAAVARTAMSLLAAQARFAQSQRRMTLSIVELPGDMLHEVLLVLRSTISEHFAAHVRGTEMTIRSRYDESASRLGLMSQIVTGMGTGAVAALSLTHAGVAIFVAALAQRSGQSRDLAILSTNETQVTRLIVGLRTAGLLQQAIEEQVLILHPEMNLPVELDQLEIADAADMLANSTRMDGG